MDLKIQLIDNLGLTPPVLARLASIGEFSYSYKYYSLRHPGAILNLQTRNVVKDFLDLLESLNELKNSEDSIKHGERLISRYISLLLSFNNYLEACYEIILGCCKEHCPPIEKEPLYKWLKKNGYTAGDKFYNTIKEDVKFFREIFNKLKHSSNVLRYIIFGNGDKIIGYYLESASKDGGVGPNELFHPKFKGEYSANSFNFDLRKLYYCIYKIADSLSGAVIYHFSEVYSVGLKINEKMSQEDSDLKNLYDKIASLPNLFFPNEFGKELPSPRIEDIDRQKYLIFKEEKVEFPKRRWSVRMLSMGDGFTRKFTLPFRS